MGRRILAFTLLATLGAGCSGGATIGAGGPPATTSPTGSPSGSPSSAPSGAPSTSPSSMPTGSLANGKIKHIVVIIQENRSFDDLFHGFSEPSGAKADYADFGYDKSGNKIALVQQPLEQASAVNNGHNDFEADYDNGKMDGFFAQNTQSGVPANLNGNDGMSYVPQQEVQPLWDLATQGALGERFFHGVTADSYPSHLMFAAGSTTYDNNPAHRVDDNPGSVPWGCSDNTGATVPTLTPQDQPGPQVTPCFTGITTIADLMDRAQHTWRWYSPEVAGPVNGMPSGVSTVFGETDAMQSYRQLYFGPDWSADTVQPETLVLSDVAQGKLADLTFVTPDAENSDHPAVGTSSGPAWVATVVNAIGQSQFYNSTAIFVTWDDWGGWYDHVPPPQKYWPYGLGFRIPLICVSPYAKHGQLIDTQLEPGSILKFVEETFALPSLGTQDATATSASVMFDFTQASTPPYKVVTSSLRRAYFLRQKPSGLPQDTDMLGPGHESRGRTRE
jgi:phospholipase C